MNKYRIHPAEGGRGYEVQVKSFLRWKKLELGRSQYEPEPPPHMSYHDARQVLLWALENEQELLDRQAELNSVYSRTDLEPRAAEEMVYAALDLAGVKPAQPGEIFVTPTTKEIVESALGKLTPLEMRMFYIRWLRHLELNGQWDRDRPEYGLSNLREAAEMIVGRPMEDMLPALTGNAVARGPIHLKKS